MNSNRYCQPVRTLFPDGIYYDACWTPKFPEEISDCLCETCGWHPCEDTTPLPRKRSPYDDKAGRWFR